MTILLEQHKRAKQAVLDRFHQLAGIADDVGMSSLAEDIRGSRLPKVEDERFFLVILGEFNHGKSTFVNALLGHEVLPTGITPTTAAINHVVHSERPRAHARLTAGETVDLEVGALADWVTVAGSRSKDVRFVEVGYPSDLLRENITLVDTPGVNDLNEQRAEVTYGYVPRADAVIFLLDAGQALKDSEREFLSSHVLEGTRDRLIFAVAKTDLLSDSEREAVIEYVKGGLAKLVPEPVVFSVSAKRWLESQDPDSGFPELLEYLDRFLGQDRAQVLLDNAAEDALRTAAYLEQNLGVRLRAFDLDLADLETRVRSVRDQLHASKRTLDELHGRIKAEGSAIKSQVRLDLESFARRFVQVLPEEIDKVDADDVKRYLGPFVEDKFKEWAQYEGGKMAALLERLAEDVIAVTNENVAAASQALASRLRPADTEVEIEVDSFKYDVGVYAVGALGTTVFLFINTLAGGLLTLAAPILAIVIKSKVAGDIREQAKDRVPKAVHRAADAMGPHFDKAVDDFTARLSSFVASAGNTLYRGISEILDKTIAERKGGEKEQLAVRAETAEHIAAVRELRGELERVRQHVWQVAAPEEPAESL
jgi:small GTP-binding protein